MKKFLTPRGVRILSSLVLVSATAGATLYVVGRPYLLRYREKQETCAKVGDGKRQICMISDSGSSLPWLDPGFYHFDVSGYCYHAECDLDLREHLLAPPPEGWFRARRKCHGDTLTFGVDAGAVLSFYAPLAVKKLKVRVVRDGVTLYDDTVDEHSCPPHFCLVGGDFH